MRGYTPADKFKYWLFEDRIPLTKIVLITNLLTFLALLFFRSGLFVALLSFRSSDFFLMPWTAITYPLVWGSSDLLGLLFGGYWMWMAGGSLERSWGTLRFGIFFFLMSAISALGLLAGSTLLGQEVWLNNLWVPLAGVTVGFAMLNPEQQVLFMFVVPLKLKYLAVISAALLLVQFARISPLLGVFALFGCAYAYLYVRHPKTLPRHERKTQGEVVRVFQGRSVWRFLNPFTWFTKWNRERKLKKLFERSYGDDDMRNMRE